MATIKHEFVTYIPEELTDNVLYISIEYCVAAHKCFCGCGNKVVTPLSPVGWAINFNGETVSLYPSIGSWNLECQSHYFITKNKVEWSKKWSKEEIKGVRLNDKEALKDHYQKGKTKKDKKKKKGFWKKLNLLQWF